MRARSSMVAVLSALALAATLAPTAMADPPPLERPMVYCPIASEVSAIYGESLELTMELRASCSYNGPTGGVSFDFMESTLDEVMKRRPLDVPAGVTSVDIPALGPGAYSYDGDEEVRLRWWSDAQPTGRMYYLSVPFVHRDQAVSLANLLAGAIAAAPLPTVPAKEFTLKCPSAKQITKVVGRRVAFTDTADVACLFTDGDKNISFSIVPDYGSVDDYKARRFRDVNVNGAPPVPLSAFSGLGAGAFSYSDLTTPTVTWQLEDRVLASVNASESSDVLLRLALKFAEVQKEEASPTTPAGSGKPGLPSTGA